MDDVGARSHPFLVGQWVRVTTPRLTEARLEGAVGWPCGRTTGASQEGAADAGKAEG